MLRLRVPVGGRVFVGESCAVVAERHDDTGRMHLRVYRSGSSAGFALRRGQWAPVHGGAVQYERGETVAYLWFDVLPEVRLCRDGAGLAPEVRQRVTAASGMES